MKIRNHCLGASIMLASVLQMATAQAAVTVVGTRVHYPGEKSEISIRLENPGAMPTLVQAWIDDGDKKATPDTAKVPFVIRPPIFRMDAGRAQVLRVSKVDDSLPKDRESLFWFNVRDVPASAGVGSSSDPEGGTLHLIVRTRIKMFYRPKGVTAAGAIKAPKQLQWRLQPSEAGCALSAANDTPHYVNLNSIDSGRGPIAVGTGEIAPFDTVHYPLSVAQCASINAKVRFEYINDHGASHTHEAPLHRE